MWSNFSDEDSRSSRCVLCENETPWGGTGVSAAILYWIGICKIIQTFSSVAVANLAYLPFRKAWLVPEEPQIEVSSRCHQGIISNINWSNWMFFGNVIRPPASGLKRLQLLKRLPKEFQFVLFPGDGWAMGNADFGDLFLIQTWRPEKLDNGKSLVYTDVMLKFAWYLCIVLEPERNWLVRLYRGLYCYTTLGL